MSIPLMGHTVYEGEVEVVVVVFGGEENTRGSRMLEMLRECDGVCADM